MTITNFALLICAYLLLVFTFMRTLIYDGVSLATAILSLLLAIVGSCLHRPGDRDPGRRLGRLTITALAIFLIPVWYLVSSIYANFRGMGATPIGIGAAALATVTLGYLIPIGRLRPWLFPSAVVIHLILGAWVIRSWPPLQIDVLALQQRGAELLVRGVNPYSAVHPDIPWEADFDPVELKAGDGLRSFPYPPLSLYLAVPGSLAGDVRWSLLAATLGAAAFVVAAGRRSGLPPGHHAELAALVMLGHPFSLRMLETAWTEPFLMLAISACLWALRGRDGRTLVPALATAISVKQFGFLWVGTLWAARRISTREMIEGGVVALVIALPFLLWDPAALWLGTYVFPAAAPYRPNSLSIPAAIAARTGYKLSPAVGFVMAGVVGCVVTRRAGESLARVVAGSAGVYGAFFVFGKAAHMNYFWLVGTLIMAAIAIAYSENATAESDRVTAD